MRSSVRILNVQRFDEFNRLAAIVSVSIAVDGSELLLNGIGLMRSGSALRVTYPRYRHAGATAPTYAFEPSGELRKTIELSVLSHWFDVCGGDAPAVESRRSAPESNAPNEPAPVRQLALR